MKKTKFSDLTICWRNLQVCLLILLISACDRPDCTNENPVFAAHEPSSERYKRELQQILATMDQQRLRYWLKEYMTREGREYLHFYIQAEDLCAVLELEVEDWSNLQRIREKKGISYQGAEFKGLEFSYQWNDQRSKFVYHQHQTIMD